MTFILSAILTYLLMKHIIIPFANKIAKDEDCKDDYVYSGDSNDMFDANNWND